MSGGTQIELAIRTIVTHRDGTIASGNTSQQVAAFNIMRSWMYIQNPTANNASLFVNFTNSATVDQSNSIELKPGDSLYFKVPGFVPSDAVNLAATSPGLAFVYKEA